MLDKLNKYIRSIIKFSITGKSIIKIAILSIISIIITYINIVKHSNSFGPDPYSVQKYIIFNLILFLLLSIFITKNIISIWISRHRAIKGSRLQAKIVIMFSLVATIPTMIVAIFTILFFNYGIESWFNKRVSTAIEESVAVAEHYFVEHTENIKADILAMANDINAQAYEFYNNILFLNKVVSSQALLRSLSESLVFRGDKTIIAKSNMSFSLSYELARISPNLIQRADNGEIVIFTNDSKDRVRALIKLDRFFDSYLLVGRPVDNKVIQHIQNTQNAVNEYDRLRSQLYSLRIQLAIIFIMIALLLVLLAIWSGVIFAGAIVKPINSLIDATEEIQKGNLSARVKEIGLKGDEISILEKAFNIMGDKIELLRDDLVEASKQIDARRHFSETILTELSSGVIVLSTFKKITSFNRAAGIFLKVIPSEVIGVDFSEICSEMTELIETANDNKLAKGEIIIVRDGRKAIFLVKIIIEEQRNDINSFIITFDDVTALVNAQRTAAWSDVARRIAHEIKNPLTPIRLAAERIRKKYINEVSDKETFSKYNDTIIRHSTDIGKIVEEFVYFARMPSPIFNQVDINKIINEIVFSRQCVCPNISYILDISNNYNIINCDQQQISQVLTNLIKNSEESIESQDNIDATIEISLKKENNNLIMIIKDNGPGFPDKIIERLTEPYVTTKLKGTGLGLAIVKKILIDHNASIEFYNSKSDDRGAIVKINFAL